MSLSSVLPENQDLLRVEEYPAGFQNLVILEGALREVNLLPTFTAPVHVTIKIEAPQLFSVKIYSEVGKIMLE